MPRKSYRKRAVRRIQYANQKLNTPTAKFSLLKYYYVSMPAAIAGPGQNAAVLQINASTPFNPISSIAGTWSDNDATATQPFGLNSDIYAQYNHVVVRACHVKVNVMDSPDSLQSGTNQFTEGVVALTRTTDTGKITTGTLTSTLRSYYGSKQRSFQLATDDVAALTKSTSIHQGYSPRKTWHQSALTNEDLKITNSSGSSNTPTDNTYIMLSFHCANDNAVTNTLKVFKCQVKITYILTFTEPTAATNVPLPLSVPRPIPHKRTKNELPQWYKTAAQFAGYAAVRGPQILQYAAPPALAYYGGRRILALRHR